MTIQFRGMVFALFIFSGIPLPTMAGCKTIWPDDQVTNFLAKADYTSCKLVAMRNAYADILAEQARLITQMTPIYEREQPARQRLSRVEEYNAKLQKLVQTTAGLLPPSVPLDEPPPEVLSKIDLFKLVKNSKDHSVALEGKLSGLLGKFTDTEMSLYCKLDYFFRLRDGMFVKLRDCLE